MDAERLQRWVFASHGLAAVDHFAVVVAQGLGRLDSHLTVEDRRLTSLSLEELATETESLHLTEHLTVSYLWVLGAYELVRTIDQRCRENPSLMSPHLAALVNGQKLRIERLRIPLAKLEPARRHPRDFQIAYPAIALNWGVAWQVSEDCFISRHELSEETLLVLEAMRALG